MILTRAQLDEFDTQPMYGGTSEKRYLCPSDNCKDYPADNTHRSLTVRDDGIYQCFRCGMKGKLASKTLNRVLPGLRAPATRSVKELMS